MPCEALQALKGMVYDGMGRQGGCQQKEHNAVRGEGGAGRLIRKEAAEVNSRQRRWSRGPGWEPG